MVGLTLRRTRLNALARQLTREHRVHREQLIQPLFVVEGILEREPVAGLDDVYRDTGDSLPLQIERDLEQGIDKFLLFGVPGDKKAADFEHSFTATQIANVKRHFGDDLWLAVDVCLCSHTTHGHCGVLDADGGEVLNATTVDELVTAAIAFAENGADCVAPSDMMDGRVGAIRSALDAAGFNKTILMSYAAKFHSNYYGPFREAADSAPYADAPLSDRASYQIDPGRPRDARLSAERDAAEGADILMVKPGLPYLDVLAQLSTRLPQPWAVYQTSGEQAGIDLVARRDLMRRDAAQHETWLAFVRAGASIIISYAARRADRVLGSAD